MRDWKECPSCWGTGHEKGWGAECRQQPPEYEWGKGQTYDKPCAIDLTPTEVKYFDYVNETWKRFREAWGIPSMESHVGVESEALRQVREQELRDDPVSGVVLEHARGCSVTQHPRTNPAECPECAEVMLDVLQFRLGETPVAEYLEKLLQLARAR